MGIKISEELADYIAWQISEQSLNDGETTESAVKCILETHFEIVKEVE